MLIRATFRNVLSFRDEVEISFVAGKGSTLSDQVCRAEKRDDISVLKAGIIYGANASGKSNVIHCINALREFALGISPGRHLEAFKLRPQCGETSKIEVEFKAREGYYAYGIEFGSAGIAEEWLYEIGSRSETVVFERKVTAEGNSISHPHAKGKAEGLQLLKFIGLSTPTDHSFLSEYVKRNGVGLDCIRDAREWFASTLHIIFPTTRYRSIAFESEKDEAFKTATRELLQLFGTGITDVRRVRIAKEETGVSGEMLERIVREGRRGSTCILNDPVNRMVMYVDIDENGLPTFYKQIAIHQGDGGEVAFEMYEESDGSLRLLDFIPMLIDLRLNGAVYLIDEIDRSMHPMLSQEILRFYADHILARGEGYAPHDTQLIFTTHESNLLDLSLIRADEVWFVEKGDDGASHLTSLSEYKPREDVRKGYLQGRYGAIPFFATVKKLNW